MSGLSDFAPFGTTILAMFLAISALHRGRVFNLSRTEEPVGFWVFVVGLMTIGLAVLLVALLHDPTGELP